MMKTTSVVTFFLFLFIYVVQCLVLDYFIIYYGGFKLLAVPLFDALLLLYALINASSSLAAFSGAVIWLLYSWILILKVVFFYFYVFNINTSLSISYGTFIGLSEANIALYFTPILFSILAFRARSLLFANDEISTVTMLHADTILHVMVDLLDMMVAFNYSTLPANVALTESAVRTMVGCFIAAGLFLHSFSLPSDVSIQVSGSSSSQGDIFLTRKHAALVGIFVVDVPLLFARLYFWIKFPSIPGFDPFLVKNIIFMPLQAFRLSQCRLVEHEVFITSRKTDRGDGIAPNAPPMRLLDDQDPSTRQTLRTAQPGTMHNQVGSGIIHPSNSAVMGQMPMPGTGGVQGSTLWTTQGSSAFVPVNGRRDNIRNSRRKPSNSLELSPGSNRRRDTVDVKRRGFFNRKKSITGAGSGNHRNNLMPLPSASFGVYHHDEYENDDSDYQPSTSRRDSLRSDGDVPDDAKQASDNDPNEKSLSALLQDLQNVRTIPVGGFKVKRVLKRVFMSLRIGSSNGMASILDDTFTLSYWKTLRLVFPIMLTWLSRIALIVVGVRHTLPEPFSILDITDFKSIPKDIFASYVVSAAGAFLILLCYIGTAPLMDAIFVSFFWGVRLFSFYTTFHIVRDTVGSDPILSSNSLVREIYLGALFATMPSFYLVLSLFTLQRAVLGRERMCYAIKHVHKQKVKETNKDKATIDEKTDTRTDEIGWETTSSKLVFFHVRHLMSPISYNELLIGPDLIKDIRLSDLLSSRSWVDLGIIVLVKAWTLYLLLDWVYGIFFGVHILVMLVAVLISHAIRVLSLRRYELKAMFEDLVLAWQDLGAQELEDVAFQTHFLPKVSKQSEVRKFRGPSRRKFITVGDIKEKYDRQGFFSNPGHILPTGW